MSASIGAPHSMPLGVGPRLGRYDFAALIGLEEADGVRVLVLVGETAWG